MKSPENTFLAFVLDTFQHLYPTKARKMFGGYGLYINHKICALIIQDELYLKANSLEATIFFRNKGSEPFSYERNSKTIFMSYWRMPFDILENKEHLKEWINYSLSAPLKLD